MPLGVYAIYISCDFRNESLNAQLPCVDSFLIVYSIVKNEQIVNIIKLLKRFPTWSAYLSFNAVWVACFWSNKMMFKLFIHISTLNPLSRKMKMWVNLCIINYFFKPHRLHKFLILFKTLIPEWVVSLYFQYVCHSLIFCLLLNLKVVYS